jgi:hypothetical protein
MTHPLPLAAPAVLTDEVRSTHTPQHAVSDHMDGSCHTPTKE